MKIPQLQFDRFGLRHIPRMNPVRKRFGLRWHSCFPPVSWAVSALVGAIAALILLVVMGMLAERDESALNAVKARHAELAALHRQALAEQHLTHLLNGGTLIADTDFMSCKLRDRASTRL